MFVPGMFLPESTFEAGRVSSFKFGEKLLVKRIGLNVVRLHGLSVVLHWLRRRQVLPPLPEAFIRQERSKISAEARIYDVAPDLALAKLRIQPPDMAADTIKAEETSGSFIRPTGCQVPLLVIVCVNHPPQNDEAVEIGPAAAGA